MRTKQIPPGKKGHPKGDQAATAGLQAKPVELTVGQAESKHRPKTAHPQGKENQPHGSRYAMRSASAGKWRPINKPQTRSDSAILGLPPSPPQGAPGQIGDTAGWSDLQGACAAPMAPVYAAEFPGTTQYNAEQLASWQEEDDTVDGEYLHHLSYRDAYAAAYLQGPSHADFQAAEVLPQDLAGAGAFSQLQQLRPDGLSLDLPQEDVGELPVSPGLVASIIGNLEDNATSPVVEKEDLPAVQEIEEMADSGLVDSLVQQFEEKSTIEDPETSSDKINVDMPEDDTGVVASLVSHLEEKSRSSPPKSPVPQIALNQQGEEIFVGAPHLSQYGGEILVQAPVLNQHGQEVLVQAPILNQFGEEILAQAPILNQYGEEVFLQGAAPQMSAPVAMGSMYPQIVIGKPGMDKRQGKHGKKEQRRPFFPPASIMVASHQRVEKKPLEKGPRYYTRSHSLTGLEPPVDPLKLGLPHKVPKGLAAVRPDRVATVTVPRGYHTRSAAAAAAAAQADTMVVQSSPTVRVKPRARSPTKQPRGTKSQPAHAKSQPAHAKSQPAHAKSQPAHAKSQLKHPPGMRHKQSHLAHEMASRGLAVGQQRLPRKRETTLPVALLGKSRLRYQHKLKGPVITRHQVREKVRRFSMDSSAMESMDEDMSSILGDDETFAECADPELCTPLVPPPEPELDPLHEDMVADILDVVGDPSVVTLFIVGGKHPAEYAMRPTLMAWTEGVEDWQELPGPPAICSKGSTVAYYHGQLIITGGYKDPSSTYFYNIQDTTWTQGPKLETGRNGGHAMAAVADRLFVVGGYTSRRGKMAEVEMFVVEERRWSSCPPLVEAVSECEAVAMGNKLLVVGRPGHGTDSLLVQTIDPFTGVTTLVKDPLPSPSFIPRYVGEDKGIFVFLHPNGTLYRFCEHQGEMKMDCSKKLENFEERHDFGALLLHRKLVVIGGYYYEKKVDESRFWTKDVMQMDLKGKVEDCNIPQLNELMCIWKLLRV